MKDRDPSIYDLTEQAVDNLARATGKHPKSRTKGKHFVRIAIVFALVALVVLNVDELEKLFDEFSDPERAQLIEELPKRLEAIETRIDALELEHPQPEENQEPFRLIEAGVVR